MPVAMNAAGTFQIQMTAEPPIDIVDGVSLGRFSFDKRFSGALEATSVVYMTGCRTSVDTSAGYVAVERVTGSLDGQAGTFVLLHRGIMNRGVLSLEIGVVPDSGTGDLRGLSGAMTIQVVDKVHHYAFEYALATA